ncbi:unnamed protein product [Brugia pahangi]|uniref:Ovule protein n=1 Tax=Brugia pahangi TaxID=6280 RepID=A0A0N4TIX1_BRUPA|nr:unnamed protein product [Brugia pahangi]
MTFDIFISKRFWATELREINIGWQILIDWFIECVMSRLIMSVKATALSDLSSPDLLFLNSHIFTCSFPALQLPSTFSATTELGLQMTFIL